MKIPKNIKQLSSGYSKQLLKSQKVSWAEMPMKFNKNKFDPVGSFTCRFSNAIVPLIDALPEAEKKYGSSFDLFSKAISYAVRNPDCMGKDGYKIVRGEFMERLDNDLNVVHEEVISTKKMIQDTYNELAILSKSLNQLCRDEVQNLRDLRMTMDREIKTAISIAKDVRQFFLQENHAIEVARLQEFICACKELKKLQEEGTLDILSDTILKLAEGRKK